MISIDTTKLEIGDMIYTRDHYGVFTLGKIVRRTPSGFIDVAFEYPNATKAVRRFDKDEVGKPRWRGQSRRHRERIDTLTVAQRTLELAAQNAAESAQSKLFDVHDVLRLGRPADAATIETEISRIQKILDETRAILSQ